MELKFEILLTSDLLQPSKKLVLRNVVRLLNNAFARNGMLDDDGKPAPDMLFTGKRVNKDEDWPTQMGPGSITVICTDESLGTGHENNRRPDGTMGYGKVVATASLIPYRDRVADILHSTEEKVIAHTDAEGGIAAVFQDKLYEALDKVAQESSDELSASWNWELSACASSEDPRYYKQGFMTRCMDALVAYVKEHQSELIPARDHEQDLPVKLWLISVEGCGSTEYWARRGFIRSGEPAVFPAGTWSSRDDFLVQTMYRPIDHTP